MTCAMFCYKNFFGRQNLSFIIKLECWHKNDLHTNNIEALLYILSETDDCIVLI